MRTYHIFISHSWSYNDQYEGLIRLLEQVPYFAFKDYSVPKDDQIHESSNDYVLREAIKRQMSSASVVVILAGIYAKYSKWIMKEIDLAKNSFPTPKKIVAVELWGSERTSKDVKGSADRIVGWNGQSIANAIKELAP